MPPLPLEGKCYIALGSSNRSNYAERRVYVEHALAIQQDLQNRTLEQNALIKLTVDSCEQHDYDAFRRYSQLAIELSESVGHAYNSGVALFLVGRYHSDMGQWQDALTFHEKANEIFKHIGDGWLDSFTLHNLCHVHTMTGQFDLAMMTGQKALSLAKEQNSLDAVCFAHTYLGYCYLAQAPENEGQLELARQSFNSACLGWEELERPALKMENTAGLALVCLKQRDYSPALLHINTILEYLASGELLVSTDIPLRIYWIAYFVLAELNDVRSQQVLELAHGQLEKHCSRISQSQLRQSFLIKVPFNCYILNAWEKHKSQARIV